MNKIYKTVWNEKKGTYVAVSEIVNNRGKSESTSEVSATGLTLSAKLRTLAVALLSAGLMAGVSGVATAQTVAGLGQSVADVLGVTYNATGTISGPTDIVNGESTIVGALKSINNNALSKTEAESSYLTQTKALSTYATKDALNTTNQNLTNTANDLKNYEESNNTRR